MTSRGSKSAYWDFVFNNWDTCPSETGDLDKKKIWDQMIKIFQSDIYEDVCFEAEVGESGTPHLQGWLKLKNRQYKSYLLNSALNRDNLETKISFRIARNIKALKKYCVKEGGQYYSKKGLSIETLRGTKTLDELIRSHFNELTPDEQEKVKKEYWNISVILDGDAPEERSESEDENDHGIGPNTSVPDYGLNNWMMN